MLIKNLVGNSLVRRGFQTFPKARSHLQRVSAQNLGGQNPDPGSLRSQDIVSKITFVWLIWRPR